MHPDEYRSEDELREQYAKYQLSDPESLLTKYLGLVGRYERLQNENDALKHGGSEVHAKKIRQEREDWAAERKDLLRKLGEAHGALKIYREGYWRLTEDISELRQSRSMRLGRAITGPYQKLRTLGERRDSDLKSKGGKDLAEPNYVHGNMPNDQSVPKREPEPKSLPAGKAMKVLEPAKEEIAALTDGENAVPLHERSYEQLKSEFEANPSPLHLKRVLTRGWYNQGLIREPAQYIDQYPEIVENLSVKDQILVNQILGARRTRLNHVVLPPRSRGKAYIAEHDRVMYCVHSTPVYNSNGYSIRTKGVAQGLDEAGKDVLVVGRPGYPWDVKTDKKRPRDERYQEQLDGISYVHVPGMNLNTSSLDHYIQSAADGYVREAKRSRPELIQAASNHLTALPALIAARRLGIPFVYEVRGFWELTGVTTNPEWEASERYELAVELENLVATEADHVLAITTQVETELLRRGVLSKRITVAPNAVDPQDIVPLPEDVRYAQAKNIRTDAPVIGFAGSIVPYEGINVLLDASKLLDERAIEHQVVLAGSGSAVEALKAKRDTEKLSSVTFLGRIPNQEISRLLSTFDIMPCPRISERVTEMVSPLKPLEAFSASKAVVLSDVAPHRDLAGERQDRALLFKANDAEELANTLQKLIQDPNLQQRLGRSGRLWTLDERNWARLGLIMKVAQQRAQADHQNMQPQTERPLKTVKLGVIADEFTLTTLAGACEVVALDRSNWSEQFEQHDFDAIFVESAWAGNEKQWHRGVGYYSPEEANDLFTLLQAARVKGIPSIFWNKEDPVHIERFLKTASQCDNIFTTDANMIPRYLGVNDTRAQTVSSLPFYAEPKIHNPLPSDREYEHSVAYAGTYYGDRYKARSQQLRRLLVTSEPYGLAIYDRQLQYENSPYRFPEDLQKYVRGALPYEEVLHQYKSHLAQLNVNSVVDSPTMYSRRVVEIAASGGIVLSGQGRGIDETFGSSILASNDHQVWNSVLHAWSNKPNSKLRESWRQMRTVLRAHTTATALAIVLRTAGIAVDGMKLDKYAVQLTNTDTDIVMNLLNQSVRPTAIVDIGFSDGISELFEQHEIAILSENELEDAGIVWLAELSEVAERTHFEDLLTATFYGSWDAIEYSQGYYEFGTPLAQPINRDDNSESNSHGLKRLVRLPQGTSDGGLFLHLATTPPNHPVAVLSGDSDDSLSCKASGQRILFAGHDLKFAEPLMSHLEQQGHQILVDKWADHNKHDSAVSTNLLAQADVIFCEWGLGNAVWYSKNKRADQRLIVRVHSQELRRNFLSQIQHKNVESFVFVGELVRRAAVESHGVPAHKTVVIPNAVDTEKLALPKTPGASFNIGLVGIVPKAKRLDLALDVIEGLLEHDSRYRLYIKGKQPHDYPWLMRIDSEMQYYSQQYDRIERINHQHPGAVNFDPYGNDMEHWYQKIGSVLSVSDFESFHLTLADGAASGAAPYSLLWPGADLIYPRPWLFASTDQIITRITEASESDRSSPKQYVEDRFEFSAVFEAVEGTLVSHNII